MRINRFFCADESRANGETIYGTATHVRSWLLIEHPRVWHRNAVEDSRIISPELRSHIRHLKIDRALLIRQSHFQATPLRCFFVRSCDDPPSVRRYSIPDYRNLSSLECRGELSHEMMFAVCTHGRHDKCCAKFGIPVWCALRELAGDRAWQCSHIGGDRFAGNIVLFPHGIYYGRVRPEHVPEILRRSDLGEVWLPAYRGRSCFPRRVQVGEYFVRAESGRLQINEFRPVATSRITAETTSVTFQADSDASLHTVEFVTRADARRQRLTCASTEQSAVSQYELRTYSVKH